MLFWEGIHSFQQTVKGVHDTRKVNAPVVEGKVRIEFCWHWLCSINLVGEFLKSSKKIFRYTVDAHVSIQGLHRRIERLMSCSGTFSSISVYKLQVKHSLISWATCLQCSNRLISNMSHLIIDLCNCLFQFKLSFRED